MKRAVQWFFNAWSRPDRDTATNIARAEATMGAYLRTLGNAAPSQDDARRVLADLAMYCNVAGTSFVAGDSHQTAFNEGQRSVFNHIAEILGLSPLDFDTLIKEQKR